MPETFDQVANQHVTSGMRSLETARNELRGAVRDFRLAGFGEPILSNIELLALAVSEEEARVINYLGGVR